MLSYTCLINISPAAMLLVGCMESIVQPDGIVSADNKGELVWSTNIRGLCMKIEGVFPP